MMIMMIMSMIIVAGTEVGGVRIHNSSGILCRKVEMTWMAGV
jgi:hypothetical protein